MIRRPMRGPVVVLALLAGVGCSGGEPPASEGSPEAAGTTESAAPAPAPPVSYQAAALEALEGRMLRAPGLQLEYHVTARGAVEVDLSGTLALGGEGRARVEARGSFAGDSVDVRLVSDGRRMRLTGGGEPVEQDTPPALAESLVLGLTRMGILHNLARLVAGQPPDHADGGAAEWVRVTNLARTTDGLTFGIEVSGTPSGSATLFLPPGQTLPALRRQTVEFPDGTMEVLEDYRSFSLVDDVDAGIFEIRGE